MQLKTHEPGKNILIWMVGKVLSLKSLFRRSLEMKNERQKKEKKILVKSTHRSAHKLRSVAVSLSLFVGSFP